MRCYHRTNHADAILDRGFRDSKGTYMTEESHEGVFLSDRPLGECEGADGFVVLVIQIPVSVLKPYEWLEEGKPYREFLVPAALVNKYGPPKIHATDMQGHSREALLEFAKRYGKAGRKARAAKILKQIIPFMDKYSLFE